MGINSIFVASESDLMDIQTKKLKLIEEFLSISDEKLLDKLESIISKEKKKKYTEELEPMSLNEFHEMIDEAILDYENGRVTSLQDLKKEVLTWK